MEEMDRDEIVEQAELIAERIETLLAGYEATYEARRREEVRRELWETYRASLEADLAARRERGDAETAQYLERILAAVESRPVK